MLMPKHEAEASWNVMAQAQKPDLVFQCETDESI